MITLAFLAGLLSILSPCVLPLLPIILGTAVSEHRLGPLALATGMGLSFTLIGLFVATIGFGIGLDTGVFRMVGAILLIGLGLVLVLPVLQARLATAAGPTGNWVEQRFGGFSPRGLSGQFGVGLVLGAVWTPCVGPTLGAASLMAARGENLTMVALTMLTFGMGAGLPLVLLGLLSREGLLRLRQKLLSAGRGVRILFGALLLGMGLLIVSGFDKRIEAVLVSHSPDWLTNLTTRF